MALKVEGVVDRSLYCEETLGRESGFKALHLPFASAHDLMLAQALLVPCREPKLAPGSAIGLELVGHEYAGSVAMLALSR